MSLTFDTMEEAIAFAVKNGSHNYRSRSHPAMTHLCFHIGWGYEVDWPKRTKLRPKSYAANFSWDRKTRVVTK